MILNQSVNPTAIDLHSVTTIVNHSELVRIVSLVRGELEVYRYMRFALRLDVNLNVHANVQIVQVAIFNLLDVC